MKAKTIAIMLITYLNSITYSIVSSFHEPSDALDFWSLSHYIFASVLIVRIVKHFEINFRSRKTSLLVLIGLSVSIIIFGFIASSRAFLSASFILFLTLQFVASLSSIVVIGMLDKYFSNEKVPALSINEEENTTQECDKNADKIAAYIVQNEKADKKSRVFRSAFYMGAALFIMLLICAVFPLLIRHANEVKPVVTCYVVSLVLLIALNERKNELFSEHLKHRYLTSVIENWVFVLCVSTNLYFNGFVYKDTGTFPFLLFVLLGIAVLPFLVTSKHICEKYKELSKKL